MCNKCPETPLLEHIFNNGIDGSRFDGCCSVSCLLILSNTNGDKKE